LSGNKPVGVLALQGDYANHLEAFREAGADARPFRDADELKSLSGVVIPGGESTTIGMLMERRGLLEPLRNAALAGLPVLGTCAGAILLATEIEAETVFTDGSVQPRLGILPMKVLRNGYGRQVDSFEARIGARDPETGLDAEIEGVFIRAPIIRSLGPGVLTLAEFDGQPVMVRKGTIVALTFHSELGSSSAIHAYFAHAMCGQVLRGRAAEGGRA
jgi:pyridoxal 5'-phosphate synthase pdxT subunit